MLLSIQKICIVPFQECRELLKEVSEKVQRWGFGSETNVLIPVITAVSCEAENEFKKTVEKLAESIVRLEKSLLFHTFLTCTPRENG